MIPKYNIEYGLEFRRKTAPFHYQTDDPVAAEEFLSEALERKFRIFSVHHEGVPLSEHDFDKLMKTAAGMLAARHLCATLHLTTEEEKYRSGFGA